MIRLYRAPESTNVERVALALAHKGLAVESVVISYDDRDPVVAVSGQPLVPVIDDGGLIVSDSTAILRYLEQRYPDPPLFPRGPAARAELDVFFEWFNEVWKVAPNAIEAELARPDPNAALVALQSSRMARWLDVFEDLLDGRDHLLSIEFGAADCVAYPFLKYARSRAPHDDEAFHVILETHQPLGDRHPRLAAWIDRVAQRPRV
jgi:glutathione S-transferase